MIKEDWDEMTDQQKYDAILAGVWSIQSQMGINGKSKVGDSSAAFTVYAMFSDEIQISDWAETKLEAAEAAVANVSDLVE